MLNNTSRLKERGNEKEDIFSIYFIFNMAYLLSYEYVKIMMDTADGSRVSNTIVLLVFPIMWNYGAAIIKIISSIVLIIITLIYQTNEYVDIRKICYLSDDSLIWKIVSFLFYIAIVLFAAYILWSNVKYSFLGITWFLSSILLASSYFVWIKNLSFRS